MAGQAQTPHTQRITIVSIAFCFTMAYIAEQYFSIADITGAYIAGIVLCAMDDASYVERRVDISNYVTFCPCVLRQYRPKNRCQRPDPGNSCFSASSFVIVALFYQNYRLRLRCQDLRLQLA